ncbi:MAG: methyltransferase domain-containing protein [Planctomycetaceae bacterium]|nr:methyltransferase domain-containing protein [Planctomycetaceae bacterium]
MSNLAQNRQLLRDMMSHDRKGCLIGAAAELDFFAELALSPQTAASLTALQKTDLRATVMLLDALTAIGILAKKSDPSGDTSPAVYEIRSEFRELLSPDHPETFLPMILHHMNYLRDWTQLARITQNGKPFPKQPSLRGEAEDFRSFILAMNSIAVTLAEPVTQKLQEAGLTNFTHLLDVGGASGTYTRAFLKINPAAQATLFDVPPAIAEAKAKFAGTEFENRVTLVAGNFYEDPLPYGADFAWVSAIIHQFNREKNTQLYQKVAAALVPGGMIAIRDHVLHADRVSPVEGVLFSINMLVETECGMCFTFDEIREDLETAGFREVRLAIPTEDMNTIVTAIKK